MRELIIQEGVAVGAHKGHRPACATRRVAEIAGIVRRIIARADELVCTRRVSGNRLRLNDLPIHVHGARNSHAQQKDCGGHRGRHKSHSHVLLFLVHKGTKFLGRLLLAASRCWHHLLFARSNPASVRRKHSGLGTKQIMAKNKLYLKKKCLLPQDRPPPTRLRRPRLPADGRKPP